MSATARRLIEKIKQLLPQRLAEVEDFVDFLRTRVDEGRSEPQDDHRVASADFQQLCEFNSPWPQSLNAIGVAIGVSLIWLFDASNRRLVSADS